MKKKLAEIPVDPTCPFTELEIRGKTYKLCFNLRALGLAREELRKRGYKLNLLQSLDVTEIDIDVLPALFAATLVKFHPELDIDEAMGLVGMDNLYIVIVAIHNAYVQALNVSKDGAEKRNGKNPPTPES